MQREELLTRRIAEHTAELEVTDSPARAPAPGVRVRAINPTTICRVSQRREAALQRARDEVQQQTRLAQQVCKDCWRLSSTPSSNLRA